MDYTIAIAKNIQNTDYIEFNKSGNKYYLVFGNEEKTSYYITDKIQDRQKALEIYLKVNEWFILGLYSYHKKIELIKEMIK